MREHQSPVERRLTVIFNVETSRGREVFRPQLSRRQFDNNTPRTATSVIHEAIEFYVSELVENGLLPPWSL